MREIWIYDIEVYKNLFSITLWKNDLSDKKVFLITNYSNQTIEIYEFLMTNSSKYLVGYNSIGYDDKVLRRFLYLYNTRDFEDLNRKLYEYSVALINDIASDFKIAYNQPWNSLDLMLIHRFHKLGVSLKQVGIILKCPKIQDLPYSYDKELNIAECNKVIEYNTNDVFITWRLYKASLEEINLRKDISQSYGVNVLNSSRPNIADKIVTKYIRDKTSWDYDYLKELRDTTDIINLNDIISPSVSFKSKTLGDILMMLKSSTVGPDNNNFEYSFIFDDSKYTLALGGLHSDNSPKIYEEDDNYQLIDFDFGSYYPSLMLNLNVEPPQLKEVFLPLLRELTDERLIAKREANSVKANTLKITINSIYGKLGFIYGYLYSLPSMYKVTLNGQLFLLQLIERLSNEGIKCFYANTDGITCRVHKDKIDKYYEICNNFSKEVNIPVEFANYKKCIIRDVNYLASKSL